MPGRDPALVEPPVEQVAKSVRFGDLGKDGKVFPAAATSARAIIGVPVVRAFDGKDNVMSVRKGLTPFHILSRQPTSRQRHATAVR